MPSTDKLRTYLGQIGGTPQEGVMGLESALSAALDPDEIADRKALPAAAAGVVKSAAQKIMVGRDLNEEERFATEAIIIPDQRPAIDIVGGDFVIHHPLWTQFTTETAVHDSLKAAIPSVGRIELPDQPWLPYGGTGFRVGPDLLMTNRHVAQLFASGLGLTRLAFKSGLSAGVDFLRERDQAASTVLRVGGVVMIHPYWDMALLRVEGLPPRDEPLVLSVEDPEGLIESEIAVIGYPAFDPRNDAKVQNEVFNGVYNVKRLQPGRIKPRSAMTSFGNRVSPLCHDSSTLGGNSGSLVFDPRRKRVLGLHFAGIYLERNYCVAAADLARDGRVVDAGVNFEPGAAGGTPPWETAWRRTQSNEEPAPTGAAPRSPPPFAQGDAQTWTVPIEITIRVGTAQPRGPAEAKSEAGTAPTKTLAGVEAAREPDHDPDYASRKGYDPKFLGVLAPAPEVVRPEVVARLGTRTSIPYHHFSLSLHKARRIAVLTAANLDGSEAVRRFEAGRRPDRRTLGGLGATDTEKWILDPRLPPQYQLPDRFFTKDRGAFDKGHLVRREDVAWGKDLAEAKEANGDTFHVTNCSPQVSGFNRSAQGVDNWGDLENYVMKQAGRDKLCVFAGPVLAADDPVFVGVDDVGPVRVQIPRQYWKVIVAADGGHLQSFGFLLRQDLSDTPLEFAVDPTWQRLMVPLADLETLNPLVRFAAAVRAADQAGAASGETIREQTGVDLIAEAPAPRS